MIWNNVCILVNFFLHLRCLIWKKFGREIFQWDSKRILISSQACPCRIGKNDLFDSCISWISLFEEYIRTKGSRRETVSVDLTKKELALLNFLEANKDQVCEREQIIEAVWPEAEELGVTDWAIDRLVARVRVKLKNQESPKEIVTVKTRGYKLTEGQS